MELVSAASKGYWRVFGIGGPKTGKTRLFTSLPFGQPGWGEKGVYVEWDTEGSQSILPQYRDRWQVVRPSSEKKKNPLTKEVTEVFDPLKNATEIATKLWEDEGYTNLVWDTMSTTSYDFLDAIAGEQQFVSKDKGGIGFGTPGQEAFVAQPQEGDYGLAQQSVFFVLKHLFRRRLNLFVLFHEGDNGNKNDPKGGPGIIGRAAVNKLAGMCNDIFRVALTNERKPNTMPPQFIRRRMVQTQGTAYWQLGMRSADGANPLPEFELKEGEDPVEFWNELGRKLK